MTADLTNPIFHDETKARAHFEAIRWPNGPACTHCGATEEHVTRMEGGKHRPGLFQCNACRGTFTVTTGSVMESSHLPLHKWALAFHLMAASKKGVSAHQLHRMLGITYKSAWFLAHRIREAMQPAASEPPMGGAGEVIEADETYYGTKKGEPRTNKRGYTHKHTIMGLVERGGRARMMHVDKVTMKNVRQVLAKADPASDLFTDEGPWYITPGKDFAAHMHVNHRSGEYVRGGIHTNTIEGYFSIFKRGMVGVYQHCGDRHLHRYLTEFDFRYSNRVALGVNDVLRTMRAIKGAEGRRLTYKQPRAARAA
jgi:transposase-like protein